LGNSIDTLLASYPRTRPPLTDAHERIYHQEYAVNRSGKGLLFATSKWLEGWMHSRIAACGTGGSVLELGAGGLNHLECEREVGVYDVVEPLADLCRNSPLAGKVRRIMDSYDALGRLIGKQQYRRILSIAVLEHLVDLPTVLACAGLLISPQGSFQAGVPSEGGALWGLAWRMTTGLSYRLRTGLDYGTFVRHEHINTVSDIEQLIDYLFASMRVERFPLPGRHLSFYTYIEAKSPRLDRCKKVACFNQL
jgi:hypothetical protein